MYQPPPQPPQNKTKPVLIGCGALFVLLVACGAVVSQSSGTKSAAPRASVSAAAVKVTSKPPAPLAENLRLSGQVKGRLYVATNPAGVVLRELSASGPLSKTQCVQAPSGAWEINLYGTVGVHNMSLRFIANDVAPRTGKISLNNNGNDSALLGFYWGDVSLEYPVPGKAILKVNPDRRSGTMNLHLTDSPGSPDTLEVIKGNWRCA